MGIHVFLGRSQKTNSVFRLVHPIYDLNTYIFKVSVFIEQADEWNTVFECSLHVFNSY